MRVGDYERKLPDTTIEDAILDAVMGKLKSSLNAIIKLWNKERRDSLPEIKIFYDDFQDPHQMTTTPALQVFFDQGRDEEQSRGVVLNTSVVRVMTVIKGPAQSRVSQRIHALIRFLFDEDWTIGCAVSNARITGRTFYDPFSVGNFETRVAETYIRVSKEVRR